MEEEVLSEATAAAAPEEAPVPEAPEAVATIPEEVTTVVETASAPESLLLPSAEGARAEFWRSVEVLYKEGLFCDLAMVCAGQSTLYCHKMVLAVLSKVC